jgi:Zn-dependent protease
MTGRGLRLGRILGIELKLDPSWFILFVLVVWSLSTHYFPMSHPGWSITTYWAMGAATALLFFLSIVAHELGHSIVSQAYGIPAPALRLRRRLPGRRASARGYRTGPGGPRLDERAIASRGGQRTSWDESCE